MHVSFLNNAVIKVGRGHIVLFWQDVRCYSSLKLAFSRMYSMEGMKEGTVQQHYNQECSSTDWLLHLRRHLNDWEIGDVAELMQILENVTVDGSEEDR